MSIAKIMIALIAIVLSGISCSSNESNPKPMANEKSSANLQTKENASEATSEDTSDDDDWSDGWGDDDDDYDPNWREKIRQLDLSKSKTPFSDASRKWHVVYNDFEKAYFEELQSMLASENIDDVEKALVYYYWIKPYFKWQEIREIIKTTLPKRIISDEKLNFFYKFSVLNNNPKDFKECIWKLRVGDANEAKDFYDFTEPINEVFTVYKQLKEDEQEILRLAVSYWLKQRLHKPYFEMLVKVGDIEDYDPEQYEKLGEIKPMLDFDKNIKKNEYYYELPEFYSFLIDEKYRAPKLDAIINGLFSHLEELMQYPHDFDASNEFDNFVSIGVICMRLTKTRIPFFKKKMIQWTEKLNKWLEKSVVELAEMLKKCEKNSDGKLSYGSADYDDISCELYWSLDLWKILAPLKYTAYMEEKAKDSFWGDLYHEYYDATLSIYRDRTFFAYCQDLYIKPDLAFSKFVEEEKRFKGILFTLIENEKLRKNVRSYKNADWEQFFEITK